MKNLIREINRAKKQVHVGKDYVHYKGGVYRVVNMALNENTQEIDVIYHSTSNENVLFTRPIKQWNDPMSEIVTHGPIEGIEVIKKRFEKV